MLCCVACVSHTIPPSQSHRHRSAQIKCNGIRRLCRIIHSIKRWLNEMVSSSIPHCIKLMAFLRNVDVSFMDEGNVDQILPTITFTGEVWQSDQYSPLVQAHFHFRMKWLSVYAVRIRTMQISASSHGRIIPPIIHRNRLYVLWMRYFLFVHTFKSNKENWTFRLQQTIYTSKRRAMPEENIKFSGAKAPQILSKPVYCVLFPFSIYLWS